MSIRYYYYFDYYYEHIIDHSMLKAPMRNNDATILETILLSELYIRHDPSNYQILWHFCHSTTYIIIITIIPFTTAVETPCGNLHVVRIVFEFSKNKFNFVDLTVSFAMKVASFEK